MVVNIRCNLWFHYKTGCATRLISRIIITQTAVKTPSLRVGGCCRILLFNFSLFCRREKDRARGTVIIVCYESVKTFQAALIPAALSRGAHFIKYNAMNRCAEI